jgi:hypothetical protein
VSHKKSREASQERADTEDFLGRRVRWRWVLLGVILIAVVMAAIVVSLLMVDRRHDEERRTAAAAAAAATEVTSPYDFSELPADIDLDDVKNAAFVSVSLADEAAQLTSYGINSDVPAAQALIEAVRAADEVDAANGTTSTALAGGAVDTDAPGDSTVTFVFPDRGILTFNLHLDQGLIARGEQAWRPIGDLRALVEAVVAAGQ